MPKENFDPLIKSANRCALEAKNACNKYMSDVRKVVTRFDDTEGYEKKLRKWTDSLISLTNMKIEIKSYTQELKNSWELLEEIYNEATDVSPVVKAYEILQQEYSKEDLLTDLKTITIDIERKINEINQLKSLEKELASLVSSGRNRQTSIIDDDVPERNYVGNNAKVAPLKVPNFNGENYIEFIASFDDLIHSNRSYSLSAKAAYFKDAIKGRAAKCISGIPSTGDNYQLMYDKIKAKYSRASSNKHSILKRLENLERAGNDSRSLEDKVDEIEEILNQLNTANIGIEDSTNPVWQRLILRVFPTEISRKIITENHSNEEFTVRDLLDTIENEAFAISFNEDAGFVDINNSNGRRNESNKTYQNGSIQNTRTGNCMLCDSNSHSSANCNLPIGEKIKAVRNRRLCWKCFKSNHSSSKCTEGDCRDCNEPHHHSICRKGNPSYTWNGNNRNLPNHSDANRIAPSCVFCPRSNHTTEHCPIPLQAKRDILNGNKACWKCFKTDHGSYQCSLSNCECGGPHHPTMCPHKAAPENRGSVQFQHNSATNNSNVAFQAHPVIVEKIVPFHEPDHLQVYNTTIEGYENIPAKTVLMTCTSSILIPDINRHVGASIFFDSGSQRTIISEKFATSMNLRKIGSEQYVFSGINGDSDLIMGNIVEIRMKGIDGNEIVINALTKEFICQGFNAAKLDNNDLNFACEHKINIANAHVKGEKVCPDILIGADWYSNLVKNVPTIELPSGLRIVETTIGPTIFGVTNNVNEVQEQQSKYANHSCIVKMLPKQNSEAVSIVSHQVKCSRDSISLKVNLGKESTKQRKTKVSEKKREIIILPKVILSLLKKRVAKPKRFRNMQMASLLKTRLKTQRFRNKPISQAASLHSPNSSRIHSQYFLKKNENGLNSIHTLNRRGENIHSAPVHVGIKMVNAIVYRNEKVNGECIQ